MVPRRLWRSFQSIYKCECSTCTTPRLRSSSHSNQTVSTRNLQAVEALYDILSKYRLPMAGALDALMAVKRVNMSSQGVQTCENVEEECEIFFDDDDE